MLRELAREEMQRMGGAGDGNNGGDRDRDYGRSSYGAQANGFQPNWAAKGYGLWAISGSLYRLGGYRCHCHGRRPGQP
ncbi:hypothetical protein [Serratia marcescens]|uniref:hypothetical protein n=1 Tax=Serratia marcescens TaxID=615 RepID=UPI001F14A3D3|nr:hypothetical protein [Serratia marcescens]